MAAHHFAQPGAQQGHVKQDPSGQAQAQANSLQGVHVPKVQGRSGFGRFGEALQ